MLFNERRFNLAFSRRMFLRHGMLAAAVCASSPLMALGERRRDQGSQDAEPTKRSLLPVLAPMSGSDNWQQHAGAMDNLGRNAFSGAVGTNFKVFTSAGVLPVWVTLLAVQDLPATAPVNPGSFAVPNKAIGVAPTSSGFMLVFGGSSPLAQETHLFEHQDLGRFALFTVPEGNGKQTYVAVVNRLDGALIVAVPYATGPGAQQNSSVGSFPNGVNGPAAASSTDESPSPGLSGSRVVRRGAVRD